MKAPSLRSQLGYLADGAKVGIGDPELATVEPELAQLVDLKFFCGFSIAEIAALRGVCERTVQRDWEKARLYLHHALNSDFPLT